MGMLTMLVIVGSKTYEHFLRREVERGSESHCLSGEFGSSDFINCARFEIEEWSQLRDRRLIVRGGRTVAARDDSSTELGAFVIEEGSEHDR